MSKTKAFVLAVATGLFIGMIIAVLVLLAAYYNREKIEQDSHTDEQVTEITEQKIMPEDVPEYLDESYEKDVRDNFVHNVDIGDVELSSLPMDVPYLVTTDSHDGSDGYINIVYITVAYVLDKYYEGDVPETYTYVEAEDVELIGDTSSVYRVHLHGDKDLTVSVNGFDKVAMVEEYSEE